MQKTILFILITIIFSNTANCQIDKTNWMIGGVISYSYTNYKSENYGPAHNHYDLKIKPNVGYFLADKFAIGLKVGISKVGDKGAGTSGYTTYTDFNVGPFIRYYLLPKDRIVNLLTEGSYQYGFERGDNKGISKNSFDLLAGPVVYFNSSVGLEFLISYSTYKFSGINGANGIIQFGLGLQVHLEKEK